VKNFKTKLSKTDIINVIWSIDGRDEYGRGIDVDSIDFEEIKSKISLLELQQNFVSSLS